MNSFWHLLFVSFSSALYFLPLSGRGSGLLLNFQSSSVGQQSSQSIQHERLTLEDLAARTSSKSMVRPFPTGPTLKKTQFVMVIRVKATLEQNLNSPKKDTLLLYSSSLNSILFYPTYSTLFQTTLFSLFLNTTQIHSLNRPYTWTYSRFRTGTSLQWRLLWGIIIKRLMSFALKRLLALTSVAFTADMNGSVLPYPILLHITYVIGRQLIVN